MDASPPDHPKPNDAAQQAATTKTAAFVFDLDDTLYPERQYALSGLRVVAGTFRDELGPADQTLARMLDIFNSSDRNRVFNILLERLNHPESRKLLPAMIYVFRHHTPSINLHPDADRALARLRPALKLGLITDGFPYVQHRKINALALRRRFDEIIVTDDLGGRQFRKPHPRAFEEMARRLSVSHADCAYVADNPAKDFIAPNALGWQTVLINRTDALYTDAQPPPKGLPQRTITSLDQLHGP